MTEKHRKRLYYLLYMAKKENGCSEEEFRQLLSRHGAKFIKGRYSHKHCVFLKQVNHNGLYPAFVRRPEGPKWIPGKWSATTMSESQLRAARNELMGIAYLDSKALSPEKLQPRVKQIQKLWLMLAGHNFVQRNKMNRFFGVVTGIRAVHLANEVDLDMMIQALKDLAIHKGLSIKK